MLTHATAGPEEPPPLAQPADSPVQAAAYRNPRDPVKHNNTANL